MLWLWLDKPWLWALFEALALTYGLWVCGARGCRRGRRGEPTTKEEAPEPSGQPLPPPLGSEGGGRRSPKEKGAEDADRAQGETAAEAPARAAGTEDSSHVSGRALSVFEAGSEPASVPESGPSAGLCHPPSEADSWAVHSWSGGPRACGGGSPGLAGTRQVEPSDWLKLRTVTLLLEHLNQEGEHVAAPNGRAAPKEEHRSPPREGKGQGGVPRENPRLGGVRAPSREEAVKEEVRENLPQRGAGEGLLLRVRRGGRGGRRDFGRRPGRAPEPDEPPGVLLVPPPSAGGLPQEAKTRRGWGHYQTRLCGQPPGRVPQPTGMGHPQVQPGWRL